jgi:hypothetical protein
MIDTWFKKDIQRIIDTHQIAVFIDESREANFLLEAIKNDFTVFEVNSEIEELKVKYEIEKTKQTNGKYLVYTNTPRENLKFIREYCETNGVVEIKYFQSYIKEKVHQHINLNIHLEKEELISAAKVSVGKDQTYWMDLSHKGASEIFDLEKEILPFIDDPKAFVKKFDAKVEEMFFKKINELIGQTYIKKPAETLANEVVTFLFDGLLNNNPNETLLKVYYNWLDSKTYQKSFTKYLKKYTIRAKSDVFSIHPAHPFEEIDKKWLEQLGGNISNASYTTNFLAKINERISSKAGNHLKISFWKNIKQLLEFDPKNISQIASFDEAISFYSQHFYKLDEAIRGIYTEFLNQKELLEPIQEFYKNYNVIFLDKWFKYINDYQSNQTGVLRKIIETESEKTAIIVGDGVSFEFAKEIIKNVSSQYTLQDGNNYLLAGLPSETEHNMSQLYVDSGDILSKKQDRENYLITSCNGKDIGIIDLDKVNELTNKSDYLICSCKDPDKLGETYQQQALKYFEEIASFYAKKIELLLQIGYANVYLVTDHGFVLTGILENSTKIEVDFKGTVNKSERFIRTVQKQSIDENLLLEKELKYNEYNYCYFAKRSGPFKTPGVYGFSHGGFTPQETIIPFLKWTNKNNQIETLRIEILNQNELKEVTGNLFSIRLKALSDSQDLFASTKEISMMFFENGKHIKTLENLVISKDQELKIEESFNKIKEFDVIIIDSNTREQLKKTVVKQSTSRDLGGL